MCGELTSTCVLTKKYACFKGTLQQKSMWALNVDFFHEINNYPIYLAVKSMIRELLQAKVTTHNDN